MSYRNVQRVRIVGIRFRVIFIVILVSFICSLFIIMIKCILKIDYFRVVFVCVHMYV